MSMTQRIVDELREQAALLDTYGLDLSQRAERPAEALHRIARRIRECADDLGDD